jgi:hypothetical protein
VRKSPAPSRARDGFQGAPHNSKKRRERVRRRHAADAALKINNNFESDHSTVNEAREATGAKAPVQERAGLDGKTRRMPVKGNRARARPLKRSIVKKSPARALSLYDGQVHVGTIKVAEDGTAVAFGANGKRLGKFPSLRAAYTAFDKPVERSAQP